MKAHENEKEVGNDPVEGGADVVGGEIAAVVVVVEDGGDEGKGKEDEGNDTDEKHTNRFQLHFSQISR